ARAPADPLRHRRPALRQVDGLVRADPDAPAEDEAHDVPPSVVMDCRPRSAPPHLRADSAAPRRAGWLPASSASAAATSAAASSRAPPAGQRKLTALDVAADDVGALVAVLPGC